MAEHERAKPPLPVRPPRPHPQGFVLCLDDDEREALSAQGRARPITAVEHPTRS
jgi:hypothetical protein